MIAVHVHRGGRTTRVERVEPGWLSPASGVIVWVDMVSPGPEGAGLLRETFHFHELAVEDALSALHYPKVESYDGYLYLILHGIDFQASQHEFTTDDTDFFLGPNYLVTVRGEGSRTLEGMLDLCLRNDRILGEGPTAFLHRIVDSMVDHYRPEVDKLEERLDDIEQEIFSRPPADIIRRILDLKRNVASLRRVIIPQRDVVARLARREFSAIDTEIAYRFRDVHDHLVRLSDEALIFQDRITGILEAHMSNVSNRLNEVMKVLTVIATIFMPLTVITSMFGMNVDFPWLPGAKTVPFWVIFLSMLGISGLMLAWFRKRGWW
jgi:magnesium transporter